MIIVKQLAAELQIELAAELIDALSDVLALQLDILVIGKTDFKHETLPPFSKNYIAKAGNLMLQNSITVKFLKAPSEAGLLPSEVPPQRTFC